MNLTMWNGAKWSRGERTLAIVIAAYVILFAWLSMRCFNVFGYDSGDIAVYNNVMWHTLHGRPYFMCVEGGVSFLAYHAEFFWMELLPIYALFPGVHTLLILQALAGGLAAIPVYRIARRMFQDDIAAVWLAAAFLLLPPLVSQNLNQLHNGLFLLPFLLMAIHEFIERRPVQFGVWTVLSCLNRESVALAVPMFGLWALLERRGWKWVTLPAVFGIAYFLLDLQIIRYMNHGSDPHFVSYFSYLGNSPGQIIYNALTQPQLIINHLAEQQNVQYFIFLVQPLGWVLPFLHPAALIALPDLAGNLISDNSALKVIGWHYNLVTGSALFVSTMFALRRLCAWFATKYGPGRYAVVCAVGLTMLVASHWFVWFNPATLAERPYQASLERAIEAIPADGSVLSSVRIQGHFSSRPRYEAINLFQQHRDRALTFEYVLLDANERQYPPFITQEFFDMFDKNPSYHLIFHENNVFVFQRITGIQS